MPDTDHQTFGTSLLQKCFKQLRLTQLLWDANVRFARDHAVPDRGTDDIDALYSGKSGANPAADAGKVRVTYHDGVRPDHMSFESIKTEKALAQKPTICCPNCHNPVKELDSAQAKYAKPEGVEEEPPFHFVLHPCACKVCPEWAAAFTKEINRRIDGEIPLPVVAFTPEQLDAKVRALEEQISEILSKRAAAGGVARTRLEYYLVIATDELMRLMPGKHNVSPQVESLEPEVEAWASKNKMKSPAKKSSEFGTYPKGYQNPLAKPDTNAGQPVNVMGAGPLNTPASEAGYFAKEEAMHVDPKTAAAGKEQLKVQRQGAMIQRFGGMMSKKTLAEVFNIDISTEQEQLAKELAQQAQAKPVGDLGHTKPPLYPGLNSVPVGATAKPTYDKSLLQAALQFMDQHNQLVLQLINEQVLQTSFLDTRAAGSWLNSIKRSVEHAIQYGSPLSNEAGLILPIITSVLVPATGMTPTRPGPDTNVPVPVTAEELKEEFHAKFAPAKRRIVRKPGQGEDSST